MNFFDLHCDTAYKMLKENLSLYHNNLSVSGEKGSIFQNWKQTFAIWIKDDTQNPFDLYCKILNNFKKETENIPQNLTPILAVEGGAVLENDIEKLELLKTDGVEFLTLTWNGENLIGGGSQSDKELTEFGKKAIKKMNNLKIGCDLSHINKKGFYSAIEIADFPLATHSNCYEICPHKRNLKMDQIKLIAEKDGLIGLCFYPEFLTGDVFESIYQNIYLLCEKGFHKHIAIGTDFDGAQMDKKLDSIDKVPNLYQYLHLKKIPDEILGDIFYKNADNFLAKLQ